MRRAVRVVVVVLGTTLLVSGCAFREGVTPAQDDLSTWSETPLAPSADLAARALGPDSTCSTAHEGPIRILIQDRRTESTAAFLVAAATTFGSCTVTSTGGRSGSSTGPAPAAMRGPLTIDDSGAGGVGAGEARQVGGRVAPNAVAVVVELADGRSVTASLGNGYWLAWWPGSIPAERVVAKDGAGSELASEEVPG